MVAPLREQLQEYHYTGAYHWSKKKKKIVAVISQDRVIDNSLKGRIKNRSLWTCRLLSLT